MCVCVTWSSWESEDEHGIVTHWRWGVIVEQSSQAHPSEPLHERRYDLTLSRLWICISANLARGGALCVAVTRARVRRCVAQRAAPKDPLSAMRDEAPTRSRFDFIHSTARRTPLACDVERLGEASTSSRYPDIVSACGCPTEATSEKHRGDQCGLGEAKTA